MNAAEVKTPEKTVKITAVSKVLASFFLSPVILRRPIAVRRAKPAGYTFRGKRARLTIRDAAKIAVKNKTPSTALFKRFASCSPSRRHTAEKASATTPAP